jgi:hypothetical protein
MSRYTPIPRPLPRGKEQIHLLKHRVPIWMRNDGLSPANKQTEVYYTKESFQMDLWLTSANGEYQYITTERNCQFLSRGVSMNCSSKQDKTPNNTFMDTVNVNYSLSHLHGVITSCHLSNTDREDLKIYIRASHLNSSVEWMYTSTKRVLCPWFQPSQNARSTLFCI